MSPTAFLVGRENVNNCSHQVLTTIVDRLLSTKTLTDRKTDLYSIVISRKHELTLSKLNNSNIFNNKTLPTDEGFESDIDNASLLSSDGDSVNCFAETTKISQQQNTNHSDSANSSSASDSSDTETTVKKLQLKTNQQQPPPVEHFPLDNIVCYTNLRFPKIIGFVNKCSQPNEFIVFEFASIENYDRIRYAFNSINNAAINKNVQTNSSSINKFNLVQRTDKNGVTHIEISRDSNNLFQHNLNNSNNQNNTNSNQPSSIISINTPEINSQSERNLLFDFKLSNLSKVRSNSHGDLLLNQETRLSLPPQTITNATTDHIKSRSNSNLLDETQYSNKNITNKSSLRSTSSSSAINKLNRQRHEIDGVIRADIDTENIDTKKIKTLNTNLHKNDEPVVLKKIWHSAEDILDSEKSSLIDTTQTPKKPERRRKQKGRAPPPPNVMKGQYVRVSVDPNKKSEPTVSNLKLASFESNKLDNYNSNWVYVASQPSSLVVTTVMTPEIQTQQSNLTSYDSFKNSHHQQQSSSEFRTDYIDHRTFTTTLNRKNRELITKNSERSNKWTNSVPRIPKNIIPPMRSRSENRYSKNNPYKYVDTTTNSGVPLIFSSNNSYQNQRYNTNFSTHSLPTVNNNLNQSTGSTNTISTRLFGLSQKLKEFSTNVVNSNHKFLNNFDSLSTNSASSSPNMQTNSSPLSSTSGGSLLSKRRSSLGELNYKSNVANLTSRYGANNNDLNHVSNCLNNNTSGGASLKSVIKKTDDRKNKNTNEKKVTFSAFATVQVV